ncbi:basic secretory protein-like protein [Fimbriiglobus ruber]|uniref:Secretory protein n=1 Tax=Fimbriiglobus ruber TaxID=1908690 RepID=A0A225DGS3_9BACT|nr:basic secretory protein-like protein [Fimbriiglobus ruber]OWK35595.1 hypothetical protein FRUB_08158 [Fimbriiglobus ruber]
MQRLIFSLFATAAFGLSPVAAVETAPMPSPAPIGAMVETSLATAGRQIRQFAFDGDPASYFGSEKNPGKDDHFTLVFDAPVDVRSVTVSTGRAGGMDALDAGTLEVSADGKSFESAAKFADGKAKTDFKGRKVRAVRVRPTEDLAHPLAIDEIIIESTPRVAAFRYPIEFVLDVADAPEMKTWAEKTARICERQYPMICEELKSDGFKPLTVIRMALKSDYNGVAEAGGGRIRGSVKFFKAHPEDIGAMVHETVHCVQFYRSRGNPGWLVEGVADYIRFFKYEPGKIGRLTPERAKYDGSYRVSAAFLGFVTEKYDKETVRKLNAVMREGKYKETVWKDITGKSLVELGQEWRASLAK